MSFKETNRVFITKTYTWLKDHPAVLAWGWFSFRVNFSHKVEKETKRSTKPNVAFSLTDQLQQILSRGNPGTISTDSCYNKEWKLPKIYFSRKSFYCTTFTMLIFYASNYITCTFYVYKILAWVKKRLVQTKRLIENILNWAATFLEKHPYVTISMNEYHFIFELLLCV